MVFYDILKTLTLFIKMSLYFFLIGYFYNCSEKLFKKVKKKNSLVWGKKKHKHVSLIIFIQKLL